MKTTLKTLLAAMACCGALTAQAAITWNEDNNGDLSGDRLAPSALSVGLGSNLVLGTTGNDGSGVDRDYFSFIVPDGAVLNAIQVLGNTSVSGGASFFAIEAGPQILTTPTGFGVENLLGFAHYTNSDIGTDILPLIAVGFRGALPSGQYSVWVQDTGGTASYGFDFQIAAVPESSNVAMLLAGLGLLSFVSRRKSRAWPAPTVR